MIRETFTPFILEMGPSWQRVLADELQKPYILELANFVDLERHFHSPIYPPKELVFNAFRKTPYENVKVVIVGQDPYHGPNQAHGLSFSVPNDVPLPPSLKNIYKELYDDVGVTPSTNGCLVSWAEQGVLLLNATLTVRQNSPLSHHGKGWEKFTDIVIQKISERKDPVIFVLWGKNAQEKCQFLNNAQNFKGHFILKAAHPSPFSAYNGFFGCHHFSKINELLLKMGKTPINWEIKKDLPL